MGCWISRPETDIQSQRRPNEASNYYDTALTDKTPTLRVDHTKKSGNKPKDIIEDNEGETGGNGKPPLMVTKMEDILGLTTVADMSLDLSSFSLVDMVSTAQGLVSAVIYILQANVAKNQMLKAVLRRMESLEPCFAELQKKNSNILKKLTANLIWIVNKIKEACEKMVEEKKSLWEKFKDKMTAKSQLEELIDLNENLTKALQELQVPLQLEEAKKIDSMFQYLKDITEKGKEAFQKAEKTEVILLSKKVLTNEEAFIFWLTCLPTKYMISAKKFQIIFPSYILEYKNVELNDEDLEKIMTMIKGSVSKGDDDVDARMVNAFFESLPIDFKWHNINEIEKQIKDEQVRREEKEDELRKKVEKVLEEKVRKIENEETDEERKLAQNKQYLRFLVREAYIKKGKQKTDLVIRNVFISANNGEIIIYGVDNKRSFKIIGNTNETCEMKLKFTYNDGETFQVKGKFDIVETVISITGKCKAGRIHIPLDVEFWFGYYVQDDEPSDMATFLKIVGKNVMGISYDQVGLALWEGTLDETELHMIKSYISQHQVKYDGKVKHKGAKTEIRGNWAIEGDIGEFYLSYSISEDDDDDEDFEDEDDIELDDNEIEIGIESGDICTQGHKLKWSKVTAYEIYSCEKCERKGKSALGRWYCSKCDYNICPQCKTIQE